MIWKARREVSVSCKELNIQKVIHKLSIAVQEYVGLANNEKECNKKGGVQDCNVDKNGRNQRKAR